jgi:hypothetical protein
MKKYIVFLFLLIFATPQFGHSQRSGFGLGIIVGAPTGLSAKSWLTKATAFDIAAAWSFKTSKNDHDTEVQFHANYLYHNFGLIPVPKGDLPLYYGIGARANIGHDTRLSVRIPIGVDYMFENAPVDAFIEIVPMLDLAPATQFDLDAAIGARFWF